jgi:hypothetical protein
MNRTILRASMLPILSIVAAALLAGCGKSDAAPAQAKGAATSTTKAATPGGVVASCVKGKTTCVEYKSTIPDFAEEMCHAGPDYVWKPGANPCPTEKLLGKCLVKALPDETTYWYGGPDDLDLDKGLCEALGQWVPASAPAAKATSGAPAAGGPAPASPAAPSGPAHGAKKKK